MFTTATIPLNFGNKKLYTTVTSAIGVTTVTEYEQETKTVSPASAAANGFQPQLAAAAAFNLPKPPQFANQVCYKGNGLLGKICCAQLRKFIFIDI